MARCPRCEHREHWSWCRAPSIASASGCDCWGPEVILEANSSQLQLPLEERAENPYTGGIPLTIPEALALIGLDQVDGPEGHLMAWAADSDCPEDHSSTGGECLHWSGPNQEPQDIQDEPLDELLSWAEAEAPFEWWS